MSRIFAPLAERKKQLARLLARPRYGIEYVEHLEGDGDRIFEHACKLGLEGIVSKRALSPRTIKELAEDQESKASCHDEGQRGVRALLWMICITATAATFAYSMMLIAVPGPHA